MRYTAEIASDGMALIQSFMKIVSGIHITLRLQSRQFETL
jgi:hypothetical protein